MKRQKPSSSDVLAVLFYFGKRELYRNDPSALQAALLALRERSLLLRDSTFSPRRPFAREFDLAMSELKHSCVLRTVFVTARETQSDSVGVRGSASASGQSAFILDREARRYLEATILPRFTLDELRDLVVVAEAFGRAVAL